MQVIHILDIVLKPWIQFQFLKDLINQFLSHWIYSYLSEHDMLSAFKCTAIDRMAKHIWSDFSHEKFLQLLLIKPLYEPRHHLF